MRVERVVPVLPVERLRRRAPHDGQQEKPPEQDDGQPVEPREVPPPDITGGPQEHPDGRGGGTQGVDILCLQGHPVMGVKSGAKPAGPWYNGGMNAVTVSSRNFTWNNHPDVSYGAAFASEVGLSPGSWPATLNVISERTDAVRAFSKVRVNLDDDGDAVVAVYRSGNIFLHICND